MAPSRKSRGLKWVMYENQHVQFVKGSDRVMLLKEHAVCSNVFMETTYYTHFYNAGMAVAPNNPHQELGSTENLIQVPALCGDTPPAICPASPPAVCPATPPAIFPDMLPAGSEVKSIYDVEDLISRNPDSSAAWIDGALFHFEHAGLKKAKWFLWRALQTIHYRERQERLKVMMSLIMMESWFGIPRDVIYTFEEVLRQNRKRHDRKLEFSLAVLYLWMDSKEQEPLQHLKDVIEERFRFCKEVYIVLGEYYTSQGERERLNSLLKKSSQFLFPEEHRVILEKFGSPRTFSKLEQADGA